MKKHSLQNLFLVFLTCLVLTSCDNNSSATKENEQPPMIDSIAGQQMPQISNMELLHLMESIPSPVEFSETLLQADAPYMENILNKTNQYDKYQTEFLKAFNLGAYGADLAYINLYGKTYARINHLETVFSLTKDLNINDFYDFKTLVRLAENRNNIDSVVLISTIGFEEMHMHLRSVKRTHISALIILGGWVEGMHITLSVLNNAPNKDSKLTESVYDNHIIVEDLLRILEPYKKAQGFNKITPMMEELLAAFVKIQSINDSQKIDHTHLTEISKVINEIRNSFINI